MGQHSDLYRPRVRRAADRSRRICLVTPGAFVGRLFAHGKYSPSLSGVAPLALWGNLMVIAERLRSHFDSPFFERATTRMPALRVAHIHTFIEGSIGPMQTIVERLANDLSALADVRARFEALSVAYIADNVLNQSYLMTGHRFSERWSSQWA